MTCVSCNSSENVTSQTTDKGTQYWCWTCNITWIVSTSDKKNEYGRDEDN